MRNDRVFKLRINGREYEVEVSDPTHDPLEVRVNGQSFLVELAPTKPEPGTPRGPGASPGATRQVGTLPNPAADASSTTSEPTESDVVAPMPGTIMNIRVKMGQRVEVGDVLCYLEAMKMHNPIHAPSAGIIQEVAVSEGQSVVFRQVLVKYAF